MNMYKLGLNQQQRQQQPQQQHGKPNKEESHFRIKTEGTLILQGSLNDVVDWCDTSQ